jgi:hypothetical protein
MKTEIMVFKNNSNGQPDFMEFGSVAEFVGKAA